MTLRAMLLPPSLTDQDIIRFWSYVKRGPKSRCWPWLKSKRRGYGQFSVRKVNHAAHRIAYQLAKGPIPEGMLCLHRCDNPPCVNPTHLFIGTDADNLADMRSKGREGIQVRACGDAHWTRRIPERIARGDRNGARLHPETLKRGDAHPFRIKPWLAARGDRNGARLHPERLKRGEENSNSKLTAGQVSEIRRLKASGLSYSALAAMFGTSRFNVWAVASRKTWKHIP